MNAVIPMSPSRSTKMWERLLTLLLRSPSDTLEVLVGLASVGMGAYLTLYSIDLTSRTFAALLVMAPQSVWAVLFTLIGTARIVGVFLEEVHFRSFVAFVGTVPWALLAWGVFLLGGPASVAYGALAVGSAWAYILLGVRRRWKARFLLLF